MYDQVTNYIKKRTQIPVTWELNLPVLAGCGKGSLRLKINQGYFFLLIVEIVSFLKY